ncbi:MAG: glycoside hydrolase family 95 protein [Ruminococcaceae bacterium]|nr:glycoside hydrolase family 95 protein [Oscillospiraceae bacterium]
MKKYELWYKNEPPFGGENRPAYAGQYNIPDDGWEKWSLPIGNGFLGGNIFGRTFTERIQITEVSLCNPIIWNMGVCKNAGLNNFCELYLDFGHEFNKTENYRRSLSLNTATAKTEYSLGGVKYTREYFASYPDKVLVTKLSSDKTGALNFTLRPEIPFICDSLITENDGMGKSGKTVVEENKITLSGEMHYYGVKFEAQIAVVPTGGELIRNENTIELKNADSAYVIVALGTNYKLESRVFLEEDPKKKLAPYPNPHEKVSEILKNALSYTYDELYDRHIKDYTSLFDRASVDFESSVSKYPTNELIERYKNGEKDSYLEEIYFQYGRYLLISSSRIGGYPSTLQGIWNQYAISPWGSGYWHNINIQMNYWPAFNTNLCELFKPYIEYFIGYAPLAESIANEYVKKHFPDKFSEKPEENGMAIGTAATLYTIEGIPAPGTGHSGPGTCAFTAKMFTDYCKFSMDREVLAKVAYDVNLRMARFLSKTLEEQPDGTLLVKYSASPEQIHNGEHYHTKGCAFDQQMVYECYNDTVKIADELGIKDSFIEQIRKDMNRLEPVQIGADGQIKEFREEVNYGDIGEVHHRHISHLVGLYPGTLINSNTKEWLEGAKIALNMRGNLSTGWSVAHKMNVWARTKDGNRTHELVDTMLSNCTLPNLWDTHPPFQIDGNFGTTAGIAEMLIQSHEGFIHVLPALPDVWSSGSFDGLTARGGFAVSAKWKNKTLTDITVFSKVGGKLKLFVGNGYSSEFINNGFIERDTQAGETLSFSFR